MTPHRDELWRQSATELAGRIARRETTARAATESVLARIAVANPQVNALATVTVHDLPPTAGFLAGEHVRIRSELGLLTRSAAAEMASRVFSVAHTPAYPAAACCQP